MKTALVTGARGFVGDAMWAALDARGYDVTPVDVTSGDDARDWFRDGDRVDLAVHCAAHVGGRVDIDGRPLYLAARNLQLDGAYFDWALRARPERLIYFSSSAAYPAELQNDRLGPSRLSEYEIVLSDPMPAETSYGTVKLMGEQLAEMAEAEGIRTHVFRPFSGYGPQQSLDYPWPSFIDRARRRADPFTVWGDGTAVRDWTHIDDIVGGVFACLEQDVPGPVNLCTGRGLDFNELAGIAAKAAGYTPVLDHHLDAPTGVAYRVGDPTKLHEVYVPKVTVEQAVAEALREEAA